MSLFAPSPGLEPGTYAFSINVSLTYLRGLEIAELKEEDMPMV